MKLINEKDFSSIKTILDNRFKLNQNYYWYPLSNVQINDEIITLNLLKLMNSEYKKIIEDKIIVNNKMFYIQWEYEINGSRYWEIMANEFDIDTYSEKYVFQNDLKGMIYFSHENSISFVGKQLIEIVKDTSINLDDFGW